MPTARYSPGQVWEQEQRRIAGDCCLEVQSLDDRHWPAPPVARNAGAGLLPLPWQSRYPERLADRDASYPVAGEERSNAAARFPRVSSRERRDDRSAYDKEPPPMHTHRWR